MSEEWKKVEDLLSEMPLRKPPAGLDERILSGKAPRRRLGLRALVPAIAAAAVLALVAGWVWMKHRPDAENGVPPAVIPSVAKTVGSQTQGPETCPPVVATWSRMSYEGTVLLGDATPAYAFVRRGVQQTFWVDPGTGARIVMRVPTKNVILLKAQVN
jgi:hypothetical protein